MTADYDAASRHEHDVLIPLSPFTTAHLYAEEQLDALTIADDVSNGWTPDPDRVAHFVEYRDARRARRGHRPWATDV